MKMESHTQSFRIYCLLLIAFVPSTLVFAQMRADFVMSKPGDCAPVNIVFTNTSSGISSAATFEWDFGNGNKSNLKNTSASFLAEGQYIVKLTVKEGNQVSVKEKNVTVYKKPIVDFSAAAPVVCLPNPVRLIAKATAGDGYIVDYHWDFGDGTVQRAYNNEISHYYSLSQTPTVSLTVKNSFGCVSTITKDKVAEVRKELKAIFSVDKTVACVAPATFSFQDQSTGEGTFTYEWDFGDGQKSTVASPSHTYTTKGIYTITQKVTNSYGCVSQAQRTVNAGVFSVEIIGPDKLCTDPIQSTFYTMTAFPSIAQATWSIDGTPAQYGSSIGLSFSTTGTHTLQLTNIVEGCSQTTTKQIEVYKSIKLEGFVVDILDACGPEVKVNFKDTSVNSKSWLWDFKDESNRTSTLQAPSHTYLKNGSYYVTLKATSAEGCTSVANKFVTINVPKVEIYEISNPLYKCAAYTTTFRYSYNIDMASVKWDFDDGSTSTELSPAHTFATARNYKVSLSYVTTNGCTGTVVYNLTTIAPPLADFTVQPKVVCGNLPVTFTPITNGGNYFWNFGDFNNRFSNGPITHQYNEEGEYPVTLIVNNPLNQCQARVTKTAAIKVLPGFPDIGQPYRLEVCQGNTGLVIFPDLSRKVESWHWSFGDGIDTSYTTAQSLVPHYYKQPGQYKVMLTVTNGNCVLKDSVSITIANKTKPTLKFTSAVGCVGVHQNFVIGNLSQYFSMSSYNGYSVKFEYEDGSATDLYLSYGHTSGESSGSFIPSEVKKGNIRAIVRSSEGCADTTNFAPLDIRRIATSIKVVTDLPCVSGPVVFENTTTSSEPIANTTWVWNFGDGTSITYNTPQAQVSHQYKATGKYRVQLTVNNGICSETADFAITVIVKSNPVLTINSAIGCLNQEVGFSITGLSPTTFQNTRPYEIEGFQYSDGSIFEGTFTYEFTGTNITGKLFPRVIKQGSIKAVLRPTYDDYYYYNCRDTSNLVLFTVKGARTDIKVITNELCFKSAAMFEDVSTASEGAVITNWRWDFGDGTTQTLNESKPVSHFYKTPGSYYVRVSVDDNKGCGAQSLYKEVRISGPVASFSPSGTNVEQNATVYFYNNSNTYNSPNTKWEWDIAGLTSSTEYSPYYIFKKPGTYTIRLIAENTNTQCKDTAYRTIVVNPFKASLISGSNFIGYNNNCPPALVYFNSNAVGFSKLVWDFGDGIVLENAIAPTHIYNQPGTYFVKLFAYGFNGLEETFKDTVVVKGENSVTIDVKNSITCEDQVVSLFSPNHENAVTYLWDFGNGHVINGIDSFATHKFLHDGEYKASLIVKDAYGCPTYTSLNNKIVIYPKPDVKIAPVNPLVCKGVPAHLNATGGGTYLWTPANGLSNNSIGSPLANPIATTAYSLQVTTEKGCIDSSKITVTVATPIDLKMINSIDVCLGKTAQLQVQGATSYQWINNTLGLNATQLPNVIAKPTQTTSYTVVGYDQYNCYTDTATVLVNVRSLPTVDAGSNKEVLIGSDNVLRPQASADVVRWEWLPTTYLSCSKCPLPVARPFESIDYIVKVYNKYDCEDADTIALKVFCDVGNIYLPNAFSPNNDGKNDVFTILGSGARSIKFFSIYSRWGDLIFQKKDFIPNDNRSGWDGKIKGLDAPTAVYVYFYEIECNGSLQQRKGTVTLVR